MAESSALLRHRGTIMRRILIDHARQHLGPQRGGGRVISLDEVAVVSDEHAAELVALDDALKELERVDILGVSSDTISRDWRRAKVFLRRELSMGQNI